MKPGEWWKVDDILDFFARDLTSLHDPKAWGGVDLGKMLDGLKKRMANATQLAHEGLLREIDGLLNMPGWATTTLYELEFAIEKLEKFQEELESLKKRRNAAANIPAPEYCGKTLTDYHWEEFEQSIHSAMNAAGERIRHQQGLLRTAHIWDKSEGWTSWETASHWARQFDVNPATIANWYAKSKKGVQRTGTEYRYRYRFPESELPSSKKKV